MQPIFTTRRILPPFLILILVGAGFYYFTGGPSSSPTGSSLGILAHTPAANTGGTAGEAAIPITTAPVTTRDIVTSLTYTGTVTPARTINLAPKVTGQILHLPAPEGSTVKAGDLLAQLEGEQFTLALARLEAKLEQALLNLEQQERELERQSQLYEAEVIPAQQYEKALLARDLAAASLREAEAALEEARYNQANTRILAPAAGQITTLHKEEGDLAVTGQPLITLAAGGRLQVELPIIEADLSRVHTGMEALLHLPGVEEPVSSTISHIDPNLDPVSRTARAQAVIPSECSDTVKPGMSAQADLILAQAAAVPAVPVSSLVQQDDGSWAVYSIRGDQAEKIVVETGPSDGRYTAVEGVTPGDKVATDNTGRLYDGAPVYIFNREEMQNE